MLRRKVLSMMVFSFLLLSMVGCGAATESSVNTPAENPAAVVTEAEVSPETEPENAEQAEESQAGEETVEEETAEEEQDSEADEEETPQTAEEITEAQGEVISNAELLRMINDSFGLITEKTFESDLMVAQDWDIVDKDIDIQADDEITPEFLISSVMRATGFVTGSSSMDEILQSAAERNVILVNDISAVDVHQATEIVEKGKYAWMHQEIKNEIHVEFCDGVIDLTQVIPADQVEIDGDTVKIPSEYAKDIAEGTVYILPKEAGGGKGGAYKAQNVSEDNGYMVILSVPAELTEVYKSISSN